MITDFFDEEILAALVAAGMSNVEVGIQSLDAHRRLYYFGR
jgi:histone acetyltransferase (RNA polymerase elongator complex component)